MVNIKIILGEARDVILLAAAGFVMTWVGLACRDCIDSSRDFWIVSTFTALMWVVLWKGNAHLTELVTRRVSWLKEPVKKFAYSFIFTLVFTFGAMYLIGELYDALFDVRLMRGALYSVIITIIISMFMHGRSFLLNWKQSAIEAEKHQRESMAARYESLRSQVNPHFLFNSFNALSNLVYENPDQAVKFIKQLSEVYRYVLDTREREVVPVKDELALLESYLYLQRIRFGEKLKVALDVLQTELFIAPLALQMLIENAIKHNVVSEEDPLRIEVYDEDGFIVVRNNLQRKTTIGEPSAGVGLENICRRYEFLSEKRVEIHEDGESFVVKLPLLNQTSL